jgi:hypothetical protein
MHSKDLELFAFNQYEHPAKELDEIGRLLGGWTKTTCARRTYCPMRR